MKMQYWVIVSFRLKYIIKFAPENVNSSNERYLNTPG